MTPTTEQDFAFAFEPRYRRPAALFGVTEQTSAIQVADGMLTVRFGRWRVQTPVSNIADVQLTGPYAFLKTVGPARLAITDRGLSFTTNSRQGVYLRFHEPITGGIPFGLVHHPNLTLTPVDCAGLIRALTAASTTRVNTEGTAE